MGQSLFESFDPRAVTGIEIVEVDEDDIQSKSIEVTQTEKAGLSVALVKQTIQRIQIIN